VGGIASQTEPPGLRGPLRGAGPRGHCHHGCREQIWGHPQAAQGAYGKQRAGGGTKSSRIWWCTRNSSEAKHFRSSWIEWGERRPRTPTRCVWVKHNTPKTSENIPRVSMGSPPRRDLDHLASRSSRVPSTFFLQTTQGRRRRRHRRRGAQHRLDRRPCHSFSCGYCSSCHCL